MNAFELKHNYLIDLWRAIAIGAYVSPERIHHKCPDGKNRLCPEWQEYDTFADQVPERPSRKHYLARLGIGLPFGPDNVYWRKSRGPVQHHCLTRRPSP